MLRRYLVVNLVYWVWYLLLWGKTVICKIYKPEEVLILKTTPDMWKIIGEKYPFKIHKMELYQATGNLAKKVEGNNNIPLKHFPGMKTLLFRNENEVSFYVEDGKAICNKGSWAIGVTVVDVKKNKFRFKYQGNVRSIMVPTWVPAKSLNHHLFGKHIPSIEEIHDLDGTLLCIKDGDRVQFIDKPAVNIPEWVGGRWSRSARVGTVSLTQLPNKNYVLVHLTINLTETSNLDPIVRPASTTVAFTSKIDKSRMTQKFTSRLIKMLPGQICIIRNEPDGCNFSDSRTFHNKQPKPTLHCEDFDAIAASADELAAASSEMSKSFVKTAAKVSGVALVLPAVVAALGYFIEPRIQETRHGNRISLFPFLVEIRTLLNSMKTLGLVGMGIGAATLVAYLVTEGLQLKKLKDRLLKDQSQSMERFKSAIAKPWTKDDKASVSLKQLTVMIIMERPIENSYIDDQYDPDTSVDAPYDSLDINTE